MRLDDPGRDSGDHQQDQHYRQGDPLRQRIHGALGRAHVDEHVVEARAEVVDDQAEERDDHQRLHESAPVAALSAAVVEEGERARSHRQRTIRATVTTSRNSPYDTDVASTCCHMWPNVGSALAMLQYMPPAAAATASARLPESNSVRCQPRGARGNFQNRTARIVNQGRNRIRARLSSTSGFMGGTRTEGEMPPC